MIRREVNDFPASVNLSVIYEGIFTQTCAEDKRQETRDERDESPVSCLLSPVSCLLSSSTSSDKMDDLDLIAFADYGLRPIGAADYVVIYFDRDSLFG